MYPPKLSDIVEAEYQRIADETARVKAENQTKKTKLMIAETNNELAKSAAESERAVKNTQMIQEIETQRSIALIAEINATSQAELKIINARGEAASIVIIAEAISNKTILEAKANEVKHTDKFVKLAGYDSYGGQHNNHYVSIDKKGVESAFSSYLASFSSS